VTIESEEPPRKSKGWLWLLLLLAILLVWWWWKPSQDNGTRAWGEASEFADPDDILVDLVDDASEADVLGLEASLGIDLTLVSSQSRDERFYRAHVSADRQAELLSALARLPLVEVAEPDAEYSLIGPMVRKEAVSSEASWKGFPNDPQYKYQWHMQQIGMPAAWRMQQGKDVIVAVIDTGVAYKDDQRFHRVPDLAGTAFVEGYDFVGNSARAYDDHGHGTHVAGTIAQSTHNGVGVSGIAYRATIMPLKVLSASGSGSVAGIADAIRYAADHGAKVINMSLGGRFPSKVLARAVAYAHDKGVVVVCAAGNDGRGKVSYPAAYPHAIAVAATQFDEATTFYSNWGKEIDVAAPGGNTQVDQNQDGMPDGVLQNTIVVGDPTQDGYFPFMGTSMASPHVAGVAALIVGAGVSEPDAVEALLKSTARPPKDRALDKARYGAGIVDAAAAVKKAKSHTGGAQLGLALLLSLALFPRKRRLGVGYWMGLVAGSAGLFFLPWLPWLGGLGESLSSTPILSTLSVGFPSWDLSVLGPAHHGNALFFSALMPLVLLAFLYGVPSLRPACAGFATGVAAHLVFFAVVRLTDIHWVPNLLVLDQAWLLLNAALAAWLGRLALRR
jgi:serine protease